jgi:putative glutamine amidotransferase
MRKVIGITSSQENANEPSELISPKSYSKAIEHAGGLPIILPVIEDSVDVIEEMVEHIDGLLLTGGVDVDPLLFGEQPHRKMGRIDPGRDFFELHLVKAALKKGIPILGICRGCQILNVAAGGTVIQDIPHVLGKNNVIKHEQAAPRWYPTHIAKLVEGTKLASIFAESEITVNSYHHQAVNQPGSDFVVAAKAPDGVIEAIELPGHPFAIGVQWHPELMWSRCPIFSKLFEKFVASC